MTPYSLVYKYKLFGGTCCLSILKMEVAGSSKTFVFIYQTIRSHVGFGVLAAVGRKSSGFCDMSCSLRKSTDIPEEHIASFFRLEQ
jgi:hypothetical protein